MSASGSGSTAASARDVAHTSYLGSPRSPTRAPTTGAWALLRYRVRVGARLALSASAPVFAAVAGAAIVAGPDVAQVMARGLVEGPACGPLTALAALLLALGAAPRVVAGERFVMALPVAATARRRSALVAVLVAQAPLGALLALAAIAARHDASHASAPATRHLGFLPMLVACSAAALAALPLRRWPIRVCAALLAWIATLGSWAAAGGAVLLIALDCVAGDVRLRQRAQRRSALGVLSVESRIALRAIRSRAAGAVLAGLAPVAMAALFVANNASPPVTRGLVVRLAASFGATLAVLATATALAAFRPSWAWARSLPAGASSRVDRDAFLVAATALPALAAAATIDRRAALVVLAVLPWLALRAASSLRRGPAARAGLAGDGLHAAESLLVALWVTLVPLLALLLLAGTPLARALATERERRVKPGAFDALRHHGAGDPLDTGAA